MITLAETVLLIADMLTTTIASVKRYKPQFRAVVARIINVSILYCTSNLLFEKSVLNFYYCR